MTWECCCGSSSQGTDQRDFGWFRGLSDAPRSARAATPVAGTELALCSHGDLRGRWNIGPVLFLKCILLKASRGVRAGCAAEDTVRTTAKPNRFLWVKGKLVVSYYTLRWQGSGAGVRGEKIDGFHRPRLFLHTYHTGKSVGAFVHFHWYSCWSWLTVSNWFIYICKVTADIVFIPVAMTNNCFSATPLNDYRPYW